MVQELQAARCVRAAFAQSRPTEAAWIRGWYTTVWCRGSQGTGEGMANQPQVGRDEEVEDSRVVVGAIEIE
jgi:hypothetical protein